MNPGQVWATTAVPVSCWKVPRPLQLDQAAPCPVLLRTGSRFQAGAHNIALQIAGEHTTVMSI